ncbi:heart- and neural crest derivatives-expressed protein 2 isoform X3 [Neofelis nebulosa]|uniref:heart- and neural crest derivatives-expressed protein 2 isoform X3 n=1 Tax=Neofelis nebulosa TaxID=61452 RepID=UPI00272C5C04|nr:heart- and neural crest derivatives-expressed protein 2 isoform X3 [Neofelis nebulosa]
MPFGLRVPPDLSIALAQSFHVFWSLHLASNPILLSERNLEKHSEQQRQENQRPDGLAAARLGPGAQAVRRRRRRRARVSRGPGAGSRPRTPGKLSKLRSEDFLHLESSGLFMCNLPPLSLPPFEASAPHLPLQKKSGYLKKSIPYFNMKRTLPRGKGSRRLVDSLCVNVPSRLCRHQRCSHPTYPTPSR